ncbi:ABC transporter permease subunit [Natronorubrum sp. JWXQ-INN-674]|uniref:ABC transporter permease subunit n=1 Tax=Natronorubrum halalkaliphilum TaxID=2691917 RepID=A0A6B0VHG0_9EURY|nr:ABC transporter permease subunit [Natronorubrum halalkaliphilum]MXV61271.1 ABC transporter permease subunit [Natronorubrum halalkaliphilum]
MSVRAVVSKDFLDARRAKIVWFVGIHYMLLIVLFFLQVRLGGAEGAPDLLVALWNMVFIGAVFVPAIALVTAYLSIAGERESGSIKHLLSTPVSRRDVVLGKYISRAGIVAASLVLGFAIAAVLAVVWFDSLYAAVFVRIAALTTIYALAYVAVAIGISAVTASRSRAMAGALGFYLLTNLVTLNDDISGLAGIDYVLNTVLGLGVGEDLIQFVGMLTNPARAYLVATIGVFPDGRLETMDLPEPSELSWYVQPEVAAVILGLWLILPMLVGIRQFERAAVS